MGHFLWPLLVSCLIQFDELLRMSYLLRGLIFTQPTHLWHVIFPRPENVSSTGKTENRVFGFFGQYVRQIALAKTLKMRVRPYFSDSVGSDGL